MCQQYWTLETCGEKFGPFIVETTAEIKSDPSMTVRDFTITNTLNVSLETTLHYITIPLLLYEACKHLSKYCQK